MQTIEFEKSNQEWADGGSIGEFRPSKIEIKVTTLYDNCVCLSVISPKGDRPIEISLKNETWAKIIVALGKELSQ